MLFGMRKMKKAKKMGKRRYKPVRYSLSAIRTQPSDKTAFKTETSTAPAIEGLQLRYQSSWPGQHNLWRVYSRLADFSIRTVATNPEKISARSILHLFGGKTP